MHAFSYIYRFYHHIQLLIYSIKCYYIAQTNKHSINKIIYAACTYMLWSYIGTQLEHLYSWACQVQWCIHAAVLCDWLHGDHFFIIQQVELIHEACMHITIQWSCEEQMVYTGLQQYNIIKQIYACMQLIVHNTHAVFQAHPLISLSWTCMDLGHSFNMDQMRKPQTLLRLNQTIGQMEDIELYSSAG